jgi:hypothetical protein
MPVTEVIRAMIIDRASAADVRKEAAKNGMKSLREDGWRLIRSGKTTLEEVLRATKDESFSGSGYAAVPSSGDGASSAGAKQ